MLKDIVRDEQPVHILKEMVRFVEKKLYERNMAKIPCGICGKRTSFDIRYCPTHAKKIYFRNWYERQKAQRIEADE
ncbi:hypothetical protein Glove_264g40 [Diversispora epigaea]|uniref:Uncharacterized protein n=1 Tax=Diversispora epigaea TaxID=1348612 RepID=A0A397IC76_9GLOM|nr:hypothetical protein Glove_264g40 [Diversispora epigaea]